MLPKFVILKRFPFLLPTLAATWRFSEVVLALIRKQRERTIYSFQNIGAKKDLSVAAGKIVTSQ